VISPTGYAVKTMADLGLIMPLTHELIPNMKNITPAFTETDYDPGNKFSVPKDYGITSFYWLTETVSEKPTTIKECMELLKTPKFKDLRVNFLEGGTQVMAIALAALGYSINTEEQSEIDAAKELLVAVKPNVDTISSTFIGGLARRDRLRHGLERRHPARDRSAEEEGPRDGLPRAEGSTEFWVDNWVIPADSEHPGRCAQGGSTSCSSPVKLPAAR
jgi:spermidine/putrescine transport system substrate-binding protein